MDEAQYHLLDKVEEHHWWHRALRTAIAKTLANHARGRALRIVDLGCGTGGMLASLDSCHTLHGIDLSPLALSYCRARNLTRLTAGTVTDLPFSTHSFDVAVSIDVLSHRSIGSDLEAAREIHRILTPDGILILQLSAFECLRGEHDEAVHQLRRYTRRNLIDLLEGSGFALIKMRYRLAFMPPLMVFNNLWAKLDPREHEPDLALPWPPLNRLLLRAARLDWCLGSQIPWGSSLFAVARRRP